MEVKKVNSDKNLETNEGAIEMNNNQINNFEEQEMTITNEDVSLEEKDVKATECIADAVPFSAKNTVRSLATKGVFTLVKAKTGNRAVISEEAGEYLQNPSTLQFSYSEDSLIIGANLPNNNSSFNVKAYKNKSIVYSVPLVREIVEKFQLNFSDKTSMTFDEAEYSQYEGLPVLVVKIKK